MIFMLIAIGSREHSRIPQCALDACTCARRFSGCEVVALSSMDTPAGWKSADKYMSQAIGFTRTYMNGLKGPPQRYLPMTLRYLIMQDYIERNRVNQPVFNCDWDVLVFGNLPEWFQRVGGMQTDLCSSLVRFNGFLSVPQLINNLDAIRLFNVKMWNLLKTTDHNHVFMCDMTNWMLLRKEVPLTDSQSASMLGLDAYFDYNMTLDGDIFEMDKRGKTIHWVDGMPHFKLKADGQLVKAVSMHTFIGWRYNTSEIMANLKRA